jgi:hypothetical protein
VAHLGQKSIGHQSQRTHSLVNGGFNSEAELDAAIVEALDELDSEERERFLQEFARAEGLTL